MRSECVRREPAPFALSAPFRLVAARRVPRVRQAPRVRTEYRASPERQGVRESEFEGRRGQPEYREERESKVQEAREVLGVSREFVGREARGENAVREEQEENAV